MTYKIWPSTFATQRFFLFLPYYPFVDLLIPVSIPHTQPMLLRMEICPVNQKKKQWHLPTLQMLEHCNDVVWSFHCLRWRGMNTVWKDSLMTQLLRQVCLTTPKNYQNQKMQQLETLFPGLNPSHSKCNQSTVVVVSLPLGYTDCRDVTKKQVQNTDGVDRY